MENSSIQGYNPNSDIGLLPVAGVHYGNTYADWSALWWKWALEIPVPDNPLLDVTGDKAAINQKQDVWFLAGTTGGSPVVRECRIPKEKPLFFPIINVEYSEAEDYNYKNFGSLVSFTTDFIDRVIRKEATLDGISIVALDMQRVKSKQFTIDFPNNNIYEKIYGVKAGSSEAAADGYYVLLNPLSPGKHILAFSGEVLTNDNYSYSSDVTYRLTVA